MTNTSTYPKGVLDQYQPLIRESAVDSPYTLQITVDKSGQYWMEIERAQQLVQTAVSWFPAHVGIKSAEKISSEHAIPPAQPVAVAPEPSQPAEPVMRTENVLATAAPNPSSELPASKSASALPAAAQKRK